MRSHDWGLVWLVAAIGMVGAMSGCGGNPAAVPTTYDTYKAQDGSFEVQYPANWESKGGGVPGRAWAKFTSGNAEIAVEADSVGSIMADIAQTEPGGGTGKGPEPRGRGHRPRAGKGGLRGKSGRQGTRALDRENRAGRWAEIRVHRYANLRRSDPRLPRNRAEHRPPHPRRLPMLGIAMGVAEVGL